MKRKLLIQTGLLLCGCAVGLASAYLIARNIQVHAGRADLRAYATRVLSRGTHLARETNQAVNLVAHDNLPFCSDQELALMREFVFNATDVRDIGRVKDGNLYCTTGIGRLAPALPMPTPDIVTDGIRIYASIPLVLSRHATGFVTEAQGVSIAVNPDSYRGLDEGQSFYAGYFYDRADSRVIRGMGHPVPLTPAEVIAGRLIERDGIFYQPLCAQQNRVCIVAAEPYADMYRRSHVLTSGFEFAGALLGAALTLIAILIYSYQRSLEQQLRRAIRDEALKLVYQPVYDLATGDIVGAEALARWTKDDGEIIGPDIFIALAEEKKFVGQITQFVIRRTLDELADILKTGACRVTLNIAAQDLTDPNFVTYLESHVALAHVPPSSIGIELTERSTINQEASAATLTRLKQAGHPVYIDDFGTGYSSLAYLHLLEVDGIKIDRSFTQTVGTEALTASVVPQILDLAAQFNLQVAVEGIETAEQAEYFRQAGCGILGQGWLFSKPVSAGQLRKLLRAQTDAA